MSSWQYCKKCECGMDEPTPEDVIAEVQYCPHCGAQNDPRKTQGDLILELVKRVDTLQSTLTILIRKDNAK